MNFDELNQILKYEIFFHHNDQLQAAHIILSFKPISTHFQISKHIIKAKDPRLVRVNVAVEGFIQKALLTETQFVELLAHQVSQLIVEGEKIIPSEDEAEVQSEEAKKEGFESLVLEEDFELF